MLFLNPLKVNSFNWNRLKLIIGKLRIISKFENLCYKIKSCKMEKSKFSSSKLKFQHSEIDASKLKSLNFNLFKY